MAKKYDVIIVGSGPSGIFTAYELVEHANNNLSIAIFDRGRDVPERIKERESSQGPNLSIMSGWGGAGAFSDGKITLSTDIGGWLTDLLPRPIVKKLIEYIDTIWAKFAERSRIYSYDDDKVADIANRARKAHLRLIPYTIRHIGTDFAPLALMKAKRFLESYIDIYLNTEVEHVLVKDGKVVGIKTKEGEEFQSKYVVLAPGRFGASWLHKELTRINVSLKTNPVDIGVRLETTNDTMEELTSALYEPKLIYYSPTFDDVVRTFCVNPGGYVIAEEYEDVITTNGHSYEDKKSDNTNFALLISSRFTEPFKDPIAYGKHIARLANLLSGGSVLVQRLGDLKRGRRSTKERLNKSIVDPTLISAVPGDISYVLPHRHLIGILEMIKALDELAPGLYSDHTLLYVTEVKFYSSRVDTTPELEAVSVKNLFTVGDGSGLTRSLAQSSASGVVVARAILRRENLLKQDDILGEFAKKLAMGLYQ
ncbi:MAG: NAD(P)/FAD-dependent oxidoreductase [Candidatus Njordarchaeia archaeon]